MFKSGQVTIIIKVMKGTKVLANPQDTLYSERAMKSAMQYKTTIT